MPEKKQHKISHHDRVFKAVVSDPNAMRDLLEVHLPAQWRERCDLNTLKLQPGSFIEPDLKAYYSDILYRVNIDGGDSGYIYVTVEHQSRADALIAFRLMRYAIAAMQQHITQHKSKTVPVVIPLLFYAGQPSPHPYPMNWLDCFDQPELAREVYSRDFPLADISVIPDEELMQHKSMALLSLVMKHIHTRDMAEFIDNIALRELERMLTSDQFSAIMHYILWVGENTDSVAFLEKMREKAPRRKGELMTMAEQLISKG
ncbi:Rpn family recombination-promoting nuclease/putative transposase, partial [Klebsiella michiganensis]|uniref:Rpn family recombination-promoting nuclease/putative transposase n=1 Tax=Klebsiella michiganensis TaxID=1134687 RepID=UPI0032DA2AFC